MSTVPDLLKAYKKLWISLGVLFFLIFVLSSIPATWGAWVLTRGTGLAMSGVTGSIWNGKASLASVQLSGQEQSLGQLSWKLSPFSLLTRCAMVTTKLPMQQFDGEVCAGSNGDVQVHDADLSAPSSLLQAKIPVPIQGQLSAHIDELQLRGNVLLKLKGNLTWNSARVNTGANWLDIGSYAAELSDNGKNGISAKFFHLSGPVETNLQIELAAPSGGRISGELAASQAFFEAANAKDILAMFAQLDRVDPENKHHYRVDLNL
ncbi:type II secretion system protein N [Cellvibrio mixtus]|uniref:type II secretion system protein N n=1 Tax=Cellvibrio mixtus TaxID=39650 RepID=UPI000586AA73|nr:type II secretion system protein N [Cellvibrio mixtus]